MTSANPYAPPEAPIEHHPREPGEPDLGLFLRWEKLRLVYNGILAVETILLSLAFLPNPPTLSAWIIVRLGLLCLAANVCFCAGPILEGYARWLGVRGGSVTICLFVAGTTVAALLTLGSVASLGNPAAWGID